MMNNDIDPQLHLLLLCVVSQRVWMRSCSQAAKKSGAVSIKKAV
jgi:hypothetical protein